MNIATLYIDSNEEITNVIERLKSAHDPIVALVVPKGSPLPQSIVNLKLAQRAAQDSEKDLILVTTDTIAQNLAKQIGLPVAKTEKELAKVAAGEGDLGEDGAVIAGVRIHRYYAEETPVEDLTAPQTGATAAGAVDTSPIIPKELLDEDKGTTPKSQAETPESPVANPAKSPDSTEKAVAPGVITRSTMPNQESQDRKPVSNTEAPGKKPVNKTRRILLWSMVGLLIVLLLGSAFVGLPKTSVTLAIQTQPWSESLSLEAGIGKAVEGEQLSSTNEKKSTITATGKKTVGEKATGEATIYNSQDSAAQTLPAGATLSANGKLFTTDAAVTVPGVTVVSGTLNPGSATVAITASQPGSDYNVKELAANITQPQTKLYAQINETSGGSSEEISVLTAGDITAAQNSLSAELFEKGKADLQDRLKNRDVYFDEASYDIEINGFQTQAVAGSEVAQTEASMTASTTLFIVNQETAKKALESTLTSRGTTDEAWIVDSLDLKKAVYNKEARQLALEFDGTGKISPIITRTDFASLIQGKSFADARQVLTANTPASRVDISESPGWWPIKRFPLVRNFITVDVVYE